MKWRGGGGEAYPEENVGKPDGSALLNEIGLLAQRADLAFEQVRDPAAIGAIFLDENGRVSRRLQHGGLVRKARCNLRFQLLRT